MSQEAALKSPPAPEAEPLALDRRRVLILSDMESLRDQYQASLAKAGYAAHAAALGDTETFQTVKPDLIVIICNDRAILAADGAPTPATPVFWETPILLVTERWREADALLARDEVHDWTVPAAPSVIVERVRSLLRLSGYALEFARRRAAATRLGLVLKERTGKPVVPNSREVPVLYFGPPSLESQSVVLLAQKAGRPFMSTFSAETALDYVALYPVTTIVLDYETDPEASEAFIRTLRTSKDLSRTPVIACADPRQAERAEKLLRFGLTDVVVKPLNPSYLRTRVDALTYRAIRFDAVLDLFAQRGFQALKSKETDLFRRNYLEAYLAQAVDLCRQKITTGSALCVAYDAAEAQTADEELGYTDPERSLRTMLQQVLRFEDFVGEMAAGRYVAVLPLTSMKDAETIKWRFSSVLKNTDLGLADGDRPVSLSVTTIEAGDTPDLVFSRLAAAAKAL
ncbi:MAG: hypothetical protein AAGB03_06430 [Pseudomonadota bacterium]